MRWFRAFIRRHLVADDIAPEYSRLDRLNGLGDTPKSAAVTTGKDLGTMNPDPIKDALGTHYLSHQLGASAGEDVWVCTSRACNYQSASFDGAMSHQAAVLAPLIAAAQAKAWDLASEDALERGLLNDAERKLLDSANPYRSDGQE